MRNKNIHRDIEIRNLKDIKLAEKDDAKLHPHENWKRFNLDIRQVKRKMRFEMV